MANQYITAQQAAVRWGISDRWARMLCREGKISGAAKAGKSYQIEEALRGLLHDHLRIPQNGHTRVLRRLVDPSTQCGLLLCEESIQSCAGQAGFAVAGGCGRHRAMDKKCRPVAA